MVGYTPSLSTAVWVGTTEGTKPLENASGVAGLRVGSAVGHLEVDDGRCAQGHRERVVPEADRDRRLCGRAAGAAPAAAVTAPPPPSETVIQPTIEVAPGITIPFGPPTTVPVGPPAARRTRARAAGSAAAWTSAAPVTERVRNRPPP